MKTLGAKFSPNRLTGRIALIAAGWGALYLPVYIHFALTAWQREGNFHHPFVLAMFLVVFFATLARNERNSVSAMDHAVAGVLLSIGAGLYLVGRINEVDFFASLSQLFIAGSLVLSLSGLKNWRAFIFPFACLLLLIVWPGWAIDMTTAPLKFAISQIVADVLFLFGLPIAHEGAIISLGPYELLVADACAGLNSLLSLVSVGVLYLYLAKRQNWKTIVAIIVAMAPIAILANIIRVSLLVLLTFYGGYDAGQGFLHEFAGLVMYATALLCVFVVDAGASRVWERAP